MDASDPTADIVAQVEPEGMAGALMLTVGEALPTPVSAEWWATRPAWFAAATLITVLRVLVVGAVGRARTAARRPSCAG